MRVDVRTLVAATSIVWGLFGCGPSDTTVLGDGLGNVTGGLMDTAPGAGGMEMNSGTGTGGLVSGTGGPDATGGMAPETGGSDSMDGTGGSDGGVPGTGGSDSGVPGTGGSDDSGGDKPPCLKDANQVILLGDSYVYWPSHTFPSDLAQAAGNGAVGVWDNPYTLGGRLYAVGGYSMASGGIGFIPPELDTAIAADPDIIAIVMDGGGNDILVPDATLAGSSDCKNSSMTPPAAVCQQIVQMAMDAATAMMQNAADHGIKDVIYFFYPDVPSNTTLGGTSPSTILDWAYPMVKDLCDQAINNTNGKLHCHFLDTRPIFEGHSDWYAVGDIHENSTGSKAIADAVLQIMKDKCIAQPESSGCCAP